MKHFGLGVIIGTAAGFAISLLKDENGNRLGKPLKEDIDEFQKASVNLVDGLNKAKKASQDLNAALPEAEKAIEGISEDVNTYQIHTERTIKNLQADAEEISKKFENDTKKE